MRPVFRINAMIQKTDISVLRFDSRWVFVGRRHQNIEGEQDYGNNTLATGTFLKSHLSREVVNIVLVIVKGQGVKLCVVLQT